LAICRYLPAHCCAARLIATQRNHKVVE